MLRKLAKATYLLTLALMIVVYALSAAKSSPPEPKQPPTVDYWNI